MNDEFDGERIGFEVDGERLTVHDTIEGERMRFRVDREPDLSPALTALFPFPVDRAVSFEAERIDIPEYASVIVRDVDGDHVARLNEPMEFSRGSYCIEVNGETKATLRVTDVEIHASGAAGPDPITLSFDRPRTVSIGGRSLHTRPEATVTVPDDPVALAEAVSVLGSSIKEFTPERSWPTLRGYPPRIERGDSLDIPSPLTAPETGVEVVVRPTYEDVYRLSTLSYYLGARMTIGDAPAIRLDTGYEERLPTEDRALEERVTELFKTWFFLDTLARMEGYIPSDRYEYDAVGGELLFYPPNLADLSMSERLMEYLEVDSETVAPHAPTWSTVATLRPMPAAAELLPHLSRLLAPVRVRGTTDSPPSDAPIGLATTGWTDSAVGPDPNPQADSVPAWSSVLTPSTYENRLARGTVDRGDVRVAFLLEGGERARRLRESITTPAVPDGVASWAVRESPARDAVTETLSDPALDLVFCDLPVRDGVVQAADGPADIPPRERGADPQAPAMSVFEGTGDLAPAVDAVDRGGVGGATFGDALEPRQVRTLVGLLAAGCPLVAAIRLTFGSTDPAVRFVGDPGSVVAVDRGLPAQVYSPRPVDLDSYRLRFRSFLSTECLVGMDFQMSIEFLDSTPFLSGTERDVGRTDVSDILYLHDSTGPILRLFGEIYLQNDELTAEEIRASAERALSADDSLDSDSEAAADADTESDCRN